MSGRTTKPKVPAVFVTTGEKQQQRTAARRQAAARRAAFATKAAFDAKRNEGKSFLGLGGR